MKNKFQFDVPCAVQSIAPSASTGLLTGSNGKKCQTAAPRGAVHDEPEKSGASAGLLKDHL